MEKWMVANKKADFNAIATKYHINPIIARLIRNRDIIEDKDIHLYINGGLDTLYDPLEMKDIQKAVNIIAKNIQEHKKIRVVLDYDGDGVTSGFILLTALTKCGAIVDFDIPDRIVDGYGINERIIKDAFNDGISLIVTCDNGISAIEAIGLAKSLGMQVVVTDHHDIPFAENEDGVRNYISSEADAIVNPKQIECSYPFKNLCGAGVAFKLVQVLYAYYNIADSELHELIEFVAIGTVTDVMDLTGENRIFVKHGLKLLKNTKNLGIKALIEINTINIQSLSAYHIGFVLGPCINATGRLHTAKEALKLFMAKTVEEANQIAFELKQLNDNRKSMTLEGLEKAIESIEMTRIRLDRVLVVYLEQCHESLAGIIAGRIREKYNKPVFVLTKTEDGVKGSGRSIEAYDMFEQLIKCKDLLEKFGGHPMAAGLSLKEQNIELFRNQLNANCTLTDEDLNPKIMIDVAMNIDYITEELIGELELLEPFGKANPKPVFAEKNLEVVKASILGKNKNVIKFRLKNTNHYFIDALFFGDIEDFNHYVAQKFGEDELEKMYQGQSSAVKLTFTYYPSINEYNGNRSVQIVVQNYR
jgi:single-stranded-DNA-specific exonuclease